MATKAKKKIIKAKVKKVLEKKSTKFIKPALYVFAGTISIINLFNCRCKLFLGIKGRFGISVNKKRHVGGKDIMKLKEIAEALSVKPEVFICCLKNFTTS